MNNVVLIDDNSTMRMTLRAIIRTVGLTVVAEAAHGEGALELIERHRPDLVCLDVSMPGRSGLEVLAELRSAQPTLPVLMITGMTQRDTVQRMHALGATAIIVKPFVPARVIGILEQLIATARSTSGDNLLHTR